MKYAQRTHGGGGDSVAHLRVGRFGGGQDKRDRKEMKDAGTMFQVVSYPGVKHSFTNPDADKLGAEALAYNAEADKKSWAEMVKLFGRLFR